MSCTKHNALLIVYFLVRLDSITDPDHTEKQLLNDKLHFEIMSEVAKPEVAQEQSEAKQEQPTATAPETKPETNGETKNAADLPQEEADALSAKAAKQGELITVPSLSEVC